MSMTPLRTRNLIKSFEAGTVVPENSSKNSFDEKRESDAPLKPGQTKKMAMEYGSASADSKDHVDDAKRESYVPVNPGQTKKIAMEYRNASVTSQDASDTKRESYVPVNPGQTKKLAMEYHVVSQRSVDSPPVQPTHVAPIVRRISREDERMKPWSKAPVKRKVLIVFAHWERHSFNGALLDAAVAELTGQGHEVVVSDLYAQGFDPLPSRKDIRDGPRHPEKFNYVEETGLAYGRGALAADVQAEQAKLARADTVIFQFPLNWGTVPAILKGYFDRVLIRKFAYDYGKWFDKGKFKERRVLLSLTTGSTESTYEADGFQGDINILLWPIQNNILRFCGWDVLSPNICFAPGRASEHDRTEMINSWRDRLHKDVWKEDALEFIPIERFHPETGRLHDDIKEKHPQHHSIDGDTDGQPGSGLPIGQHSGGKIKPGSMYRPHPVPPQGRCNHHK